MGSNSSRNIVKYKMVKGLINYPDDYSTKVNNLLKEGYELLGETYVGDNYYHQTMVLCMDSKSLIVLDENDQVKLKDVIEKLISTCDTSLLLQHQENLEFCIGTLKNILGGNNGQ